MKTQLIRSRPTYAISPNPAHCVFIFSQHFPPCVTTNLNVLISETCVSRLSLIPHKVSLCTLACTL